jgi:hypothetical protein
MKIPAPLFRKDPRRTSGAALVVVLMVLVMATIMIVTFSTLMSSDYKASSTRARELEAVEIGKGGLAWATGQLRKEALAANPIPITTRAAMVPSRASAKDTKGTASAIKNLIKRTDRAIPFYTGGDSVASASSSSVASRSGRLVSVDRWLKPRLCGTAISTNVPAGEFVAPDWVYLTTSGPQPVTIPADAKKIVGRFACAVYDVGGLADINIVGTHPDTVITASVPLPVLARKGSPRLLSLSKIPGFPVFPATYNGRDELAMANMIHRFREAGTIAKGAGDGSGWTADITAAGRKPDADKASRYLDFMDVKTRGGTKILDSDARFLSRQDLLTFWTRTDLHQLGLPFLTVFSREVNRPNFSPSTLTPAATTTDRDFSAFQNPATAANLKRFNLQRLNYFEQFKETGDLAVAAKILTHFGLAPVGSVPGTRDGRLKMVWKYKAGTIAAKKPGEQADFFETLKLALLPASLAKTAITKATYTRGNDNSITYDLDRNADLQIMRIGANLLDQWDRDGWPTFLQFDFPQDTIEMPNTAYRKANDRIVAGVENLPYLNRVFAIPRRYNAANVAHYYTFEVWNPHGNAATPPAERPTAFEIIPSGSAQMQLMLCASQTPAAPASGWPTSAFAPLVGGVQFGALANDAREPVSLDASNATTLHPSGSDAGSLTPIGLRGVGHAMAHGDQRHGTGGSVVQQIYINTRTNDEPTFELRVQGMAVPYSTFRLLAAVTSIGLRDGWPLGVNADAGRTLFSTDLNAPGKLQNFGWDYRMVGYARSDPRTSRFGSPALKQLLSASAAAFPGQGLRPSGNGVNTIFTNPDAEGNGWTLSANVDMWTGPKAREYGLLAENGPASATRYTDPDGQLRWADNYRAFQASSADNLFAAGKSDLRPVMLDRPFRSIAEIGFVFRDMPWKTLDFSNPNSADQALLDVFTLEGDPDLDDSLGAPPKILQGRVDLNTPHPEVLAAALAGAGKTALDGVPSAAPATISAADAAAIATEFVTQTGTARLRNKAEAVQALAALGTTLPKIKTQREAAARALVGVGQVGTWNVMIDVIAQSGIYPANAANLDSDFIVRSERRYWLHLAIDRYTGKVVDQMLELVID